MDRVVLLLAGYDMACQISADGRSCEIVPIVRPVLITEEYSPGNRMRELVAAFREEPGVTLNRQGNRLAITGRWEDQQRAQEIIAGRVANKRSVRANQNRIQERRFSLKIENQQVGRVIDQLASQLKYAVDWNVAANKRRDQLISCEIQDGSTEELLAGVLTPAGLTYSLDGKQLTILPAE